MALTQPESYLKKRVWNISCEYFFLIFCAQKRTLRGSSPSPDVCLAYSLYLECGKLINLHDWLQVRYWNYRVRLLMYHYRHLLQLWSQMDGQREVCPEEEEVANEQQIDSLSKRLHSTVPF